LVLNWTDDTLSPPVDTIGDWCVGLLDECLGLNVLEVAHLCKDFLCKLLLGHVCELVNTHFVGLTGISVMLLDLFEVLLEDIEAVNLLSFRVLFIKCSLEFLELSSSGRVLMLR